MENLELPRRRNALRTRLYPSGVVYFIQDPGDDHAGPIKIGWTTISVGERLLKLQVGCPRQLLVLGFMEGRAEIEHQVHERFASLRVRAEWYRPSVELLTFIREKNNARAMEILDVGVGMCERGEAGAAWAVEFAMENFV